MAIGRVNIITVVIKNDRMQEKILQANTWYYLDVHDLRMIYWNLKYTNNDDIF